jgi:signal transduction histidine kinase
MVAHEFRTPLNIIQTQMSVLRKEIEYGIDQINRRIQAVQSATDRLAVMFDRWLNSAAVIQSSHSFLPSPQILEHWLPAQLAKFSHLLQNHKFDLRLNGQLSTAMVDDYHLGVALSNLIDNACKYSPADTTLTIEVLHKPGFTGIAVKDEGLGISAESHADVFTAFSRAIRHEQIPGVGLGLSIVQRIVLAHGGHVSLESSPGEGSTFCIWLQRVTSEGQE